MGGLFGTFKTPPMPGLISGYGGGTFNMDGSVATPVQDNTYSTDFGPRPAGIDQAAAYAGPKKKGGIFGTGLKWDQIAGPIADALFAVNGDRSMPYTMMQNQRRQQDRALQLQALQQQQELARQLAVKQWERENPAPTETQRTYEWYKTLDPSGQQLYAQLHPQYITADNGDGTKTVVPVTPQMFNGQQAPQQPTHELPKGYTITGGPAGNGGGGFR